ncbi:hypothetical protein BGW36DRAFT_425996 [Talaromyces proteolyticus]|uniref:SWIM-type domain-containing protein n=1 Tax=Talaromyces proteolyticus TaxID=1131652 RepID=A0AAD4KQI3_9EURO|nr:uncharacterized protein BGW36DRAFT_425996 [Talaromyces proteolyticus]KAH8698284.1 hypothetical protein BGW36DRAFT_425996 [Talaromyces proteolyticus]
MSPPPTRQLGKLSLGGNMPTTRSQAHRLANPGLPRNDREQGDDKERGGNSQELEHDSQSESDDSAEASDTDALGDDEDDEDDSDSQRALDPLASMVRGRSHIVYDIESLDDDSRARALAGLSGQFDMVYCRAAPSFYEFQLAERPQIRIRQGGAECTCSEYQNRPDMACRHIFWLVDQVYENLSPHAPQSGLPLSKDGFSPSLPRLHTLLHDQLDRVANAMEWRFVPGSPSPSESSSEMASMSRQDKVRDILSAFNEVTLPENFRKDLAETTTEPRTPEQCVVQGDFEATVFRLAVHDDNVFTSIRKAMPAGACAAIFFDKAQKQSRRLLQYFDEYRRSGRLPPERRSLEVKVVASELRLHVKQIRENIKMRIPYGSKGAVEALLALLQDISARNIDAFEQSLWGRVPPVGEDEDDRNLYEQLIGQANETGDMFVLDALEELPISVLGSYVRNLTDILRKTEINRAPPSFVLKLKSLIHEAQSSLAASRAKRPATGDAGGNQKRTR